jgi:hypothetical protein
MKKVTNKVGLLATELGYHDGSDIWTFYSKEAKTWVSTNTIGGISGYEKTYKKCTQTELQSWLRKKDIEVYGIPTIYDGVKTYSGILHTEKYMKYVGTNIKTYEKAIEMALLEGLQMLKSQRNDREY